MTSRKPPSQRDSSATQQRMARTLQSMTPGTMGGRVANAGPLSKASGTDAGGLSRREIVFSFSGRLVQSVSPPYTIPSGDVESIANASVSLGTASSTTVRVDLLKNGLIVISITLGAAVKYVTAPVTDTLAALDVLEARIFTPGTGAIDATMQVSFG